MIVSNNIILSSKADNNTDNDNCIIIYFEHLPAVVTLLLVDQNSEAQFRIFIPTTILYTYKFIIIVISFTLVHYPSVNT